MADFLVFSDLPALTAPNDSDEIMVVQAGVAKKTVRSDLVAGLLKLGTSTALRPYQLVNQSVLSDSLKLMVDLDNFGEARHITIGQLGTYLGANLGTGGVDISAQVTAAQNAATAASSSKDSAASSATTAVNAASDASAASASAQGAVDNATAASDLAKRYANNEPGVPVETNTFSALHWSEVARGYARQNATLQAKVLDGTVTSPYTLLAADLFKFLIVDRTTSLQVVCPLNLFTDPPTAGFDQALAWVEVVQKNTGAVSFIKQGAGSGGTTTTVAPAAISASDQGQNRRANNQPAAVLTITLNNLVIPAGVARRIVVMCMSQYLNGTTGSVTVTCAQATNVTRAQGDGDGNPTGSAAIRGDLWTMDIADGAQVTATVVATSTSGCQTIWARAWAVSNCDGFESSQILSKGTAATTTSRTITPTVARSLVLFGAGFVGNTATPLSAAPTTGLTTDTNGKTDFNTAAADFGYIAGNYTEQAAAALAITITSPVSAQSMMMGISAKPHTSTVTNPSGSGLITLANPAQTTGAGSHAFLLASSNGADWYLDV